MRFLVRQLNGKWASVNEHVFRNRKYVVDDKGQALFSATYMTVGNDIAIAGTVSADELGKLMRFIGINVPQTTYLPIVEEPETVHIVKGRRATLHVLKTGETWTKQKAA